MKIPLTRAIRFAAVLPVFTSALLNSQVLVSGGGGDTLAAAFARLGGLYEDVPSNPDELTDCVQKRDYACLWNYRLNRAAVQRIFDQGRETALMRTLEGLEKHCRETEKTEKRNVTSPWDTCNGAATTLYFFYKRPEDEAIRHALAKFDAVLIKHIFEDAEGCFGGWCQNRPDKEAWLTLIDSWKVLDEPNERNRDRKYFAGMFGLSSPSSSALLLIDPEYVANEKLETKIDAVLRPSKYYAPLQRQIARFGITPRGL